MSGMTRNIKELLNVSNCLMLLDVGLLGWIDGVSAQLRVLFFLDQINAAEFLSANHELIALRREVKRSKH